MRREHANVIKKHTCPACGREIKSAITSTRDGKINAGDYITISNTAGGSLATGNYAVTLLWAQDGSQIAPRP